MNWTEIWMTLFGRNFFLGIDMGFWVSMGVVVLIVIIMNAVFWSMKPEKEIPDDEKRNTQTSKA